MEVRSRSSSLALVIPLFELKAARVGRRNTPADSYAEKSVHASSAGRAGTRRRVETGSTLQGEGQEGWKALELWASSLISSAPEKPSEGKSSISYRPRISARDLLSAVFHPAGILRELPTFELTVSSLPFLPLSLFPQPLHFLFLPSPHLLGNKKNLSLESTPPTMSSSTRLRPTPTSERSVLVLFLTS